MIVKPTIKTSRSRFRNNLLIHAIVYCQVHNADDYFSFTSNINVNVCFTSASAPPGPYVFKMTIVLFETEYQIGPPQAFSFGADVAAAESDFPKASSDSGRVLPLVELLVMISQCTKFYIPVKRSK